MDPSVWGPHAWIFLESICLAYPKNPTEEDRINTKNFFIALQYVLPCYGCRINYAKHMSSRPLTDKDLSSKESLMRWIINLHNDVNEMKGKPKFTYEQAVKKYSKLYGRFNVYHQICIVMILFLIIIMSILIVMFIRKKN